MDKLFAGFGEIMLRLCPEGKKRFSQVLPGRLEATYGGGEANVCASVAMLGCRARYLTALPDNAIARACTGELAGLGVDVSRVLLAPTGRMGVYYAEHGSNMRGSAVLYDREHSTIAELGPDAYDLAAMLEGVGHLHLTGITPALSRSAFETTLAIARQAASQGITLSVDLNYRKKLWNWEPGTARNDLAQRCMEPIATLADIIIGNEEDAADVFGIHAEHTAIDQGQLNVQGYADVARQLAQRFPKAAKIAITLRESHSADHNNWGGMLYDTRLDQPFFAPLDADGHYAPYEIHDIVDRFGGGDSFCAGLLVAATLDDDPQFQIRFAVAASALKHTIPGDYNRVSRAEIFSLVKGSASGRVQR